jgi:DNA replication initiation complex subunit (GINS family)
MKEKSLSSLKEDCSLTVDNAEVQLRNARKIIEDIYNRREKKIFGLALTKSRTKSKLVDTSSLLPEEKVFFTKVTHLLNDFRSDILLKLLSKEVPIISGCEEEFTEKISEDKNEKQSKKEEVEYCINDKEDLSSEVLIDILEYVDKFVGPDLEIMGPFEKGESIKVCLEVAEALVKKGVAKNHN